jgi:mRNA-degrading endonuclease RelE of RelBE toxin-antitoxin system
MMQIDLSERVKTVLHTLGRDDRERVRIWFDYLQNWDEDAFVRSQSVMLDVQGQTVYMFRTSTEVRIFYTVDLRKKTIHVIDLTTRDTILSSGGVSTGGE